jgi:hypothetical protein
MSKVRIELDEGALQGLEGFGIKYTFVTDPQPIVTTEEFKPQDFIFLEGRDGKEGHPDLWVAKYRLSASPLVKQLGKTQGLDLQDTAKEANGRGYLGNVSQEQALRLNLSLGGRTLHTGLARELFGILLSGKAYDGRGRKIRETEQSQIFNEITEVRGPYRAEWFEDSFRQEDEEMTVDRNHVLQGGVIVPTYSEKMEPYLIESRTPGISLKTWVKSATSQGFLKPNTKKGSFFYWPPSDGSVAGVYAYPIRADLDLNRSRHNAYPQLGVRHVREAPQK